MRLLSNGKSNIFRNVKRDREPVIIKANPSLRASIKSNNKLRAKEHEQIKTDAQEEAKSLIDKAEVEAKEIVSLAQAEAEKMLRAAQEEGYQTGFDKGNEQAQSVIRQAQELKLAMDKERVDLIRGAHRELLGLAVEIAEKILRTKIKSDDQMVLRVVKDIIDDKTNEEKIIIKVSIDDYEFVNSKAKDLAATIPSRPEIIVVPEHELDKGDCLIQTINGEKDATITTALAEIDEALRGLTYED